MKSLLLLFLLFAFQASSQLTNGQVYNYSIGDVHQTNNYGTGTGQQGGFYTLDSIVNKITGNDSITYTIQRHVMFIGPSFPPTHTQNTVIQVITNLNATATHFSATSCDTNHIYTDSMFTGSCGESVYIRIGGPDTCFEPTLWHSKLLEGLDGPYEMIYETSEPTGGYEKELIYSKTAQWGECGTYYDMTLGIEDLTLPEPKLIKIVDILGNESEEVPNKLLIYLYSDGTTQKVFRVE